jgi:hypothetical protein
MVASLTGTVSFLALLDWLRLVVVAAGGVQFIGVCLCLREGQAPVHRQGMASAVEPLSINDARYSASMLRLKTLALLS